MRSAPDALLIGAALPGGLRIIQRLAAGGASWVYAAHWQGGGGASAGPSLPDRVAVKVLRPEHASSTAALAAFEREAAVASQIEHPNVLRVFGAGVLAEGLPYMTMELLAGRDLADTLARACPLAPRRAAQIARGAAAGLGAAHRAGILHRDVKPENIFLVHAADGSEIVRVLDFGAAEAKGLAGTPEYMAPEAARGEALSPAADIYSLGLVLLEMLTGRLAPETPVGDAGLAEVVARALAAAPEARFSSMEELERALEALL